MKVYMKTVNYILSTHVFNLLSHCVVMSKVFFVFYK